MAFQTSSCELFPRPCLLLCGDSVSATLAGADIFSCVVSGVLRSMIRNLKYNVGLFSLPLCSLCACGGGVVVDVGCLIL